MIKNIFIFISIFVLVFALLCFISGCANHLSSPEENNINMAAMDNMQLGLAYLAQGDNVRAKARLLVAQKLAPEDPIVLDAMAYYLQNTGDMNAAARYYARASQLAPHNGAVLNNEAVFLCRQQQPQKAIRLFMAAVAEPDYLHSAQAYENAGLCALTLPSPVGKKLARAYFQKALRQDPGRPVSLWGLALKN